MSCIPQSDVEEKKFLAPVSWYALMLCHKLCGLQHLVNRCVETAVSLSQCWCTHVTLTGAMQGGSSFHRVSSMSGRHNLIGGDFIGSLPKAMTMEQRQSVKDSVGLSPSLSQLGSLPPVRLPSK